MGVFDKLLDAIKLNDDYDEEDSLDETLMDDDEGFLEPEEDSSRPRSKFLEKFARKKADTSDLDDFDDEDSFPEPAPKLSTKTTPRVTLSNTAGKEKVAPAPQPSAPRTERISRQSTAPSSKITPMRSSRRTTSGASNVEVCVIRPVSMENTREIADTLLDNSTVILNLEGIDVDLAQRIIDFTSGCCYTLGGTLQKVSSYIFVLGPSNVDITGDLQNIMGGQMPSVRAGY